MKTPWKFVGLDVHKETIAVAVFGSQGSEPEAEFVIPNDSRKTGVMRDCWAVC